MQACACPARRGIVETHIRAAKRGGGLIYRKPFWRYAAAHHATDVPAYLGGMKDGRQESLQACRAGAMSLRCLCT
jgi:hypothetical protein